MKKMMVLCAAAAVLTLASMPAMAQAYSRTKATVPFAFSVNGVNMPAGKYVFESNPLSGMLKIVDPAGGGQAFLTVPVGNPNEPASPRLVFHKTGSRYRLSEVWIPGAANGSSLPMTKQDKLAENRAKASVIEVALNRD
jgi:hypothetical protein